MAIFGAIEAGGTKFVCGIGNSRDGSLASATIPTSDPIETFAAVQAFFSEGQRFGPLSGLGIASFGPIALCTEAPDHGTILRTPKPGWQGTSMAELARMISDAPFGIDTDVNAAALAEASMSGVRNLAYVTVGTGIGVGLVSNGAPVHGVLHPELGHMLPRRHPGSDGIKGCCPFHGDCLEGLASGTAIIAAWGKSASHYAAGDPIWEIEAYYLAQLCTTLVLTIAPERIVFGGGVMKQLHLLPLIRKQTEQLLAGYATYVDADWLDKYLTSPVSVEPSGLMGAYLLAEQAWQRNGSK